MLKFHFWYWIIMTNKGVDDKQELFSIIICHRLLLFFTFYVNSSGINWGLFPIILLYWPGREYLQE